MENKDKESRWSKFVSSFEEYKYTCLSDIEESYLTSQEKSIMYKEASDALKLQIKNIHERRRQNKTQTKRNDQDH
jgi:hypothetical protein